MKHVNRLMLVDASHRLMFEMTDAEYEVLLDEFSILLKQMDAIGDIEGVDELEPMTFPFDVTTSYLRKDEPIQTLTQDQALQNAGQKQSGFVKLPKVVGS
jgi:aspartyl-tRNA(Asn)/glutamyl-tRNA(Gln) amidotransferase subunit C